MIKTYEEAIDKVFSDEKLNDYNLEKIKKAQDLLENHLEGIEIIHIAGTNGKGSVTKMTYSILKQAGYNVGVFTSPHLIDIRERFETTEGYITKGEFLDILNKILNLRIEFSYFEKCTLIAFEFFKLRNVGYAVIEVGLGGRLDSTNVVNPSITCITSISYDHQHILGDTLEKISFEKAGIIKTGIPIVINHRNQVIEDTARNKGSKVIFTDKLVKTNMLGNYQERNAGLAYEICKYLGIGEKIILEGLQNVIHNGRLQYLSKNLLIDGAHNEGCLKELKIYIESIKSNFKKINFCFSLKKGKHINLITKILGTDKNYIIVDKININLENPKLLQNEFKEIGFKIPTYDKEKIIQLVEKNTDELYLVFRSLYMIGDFFKFNEEIGKRK